MPGDKKTRNQQPRDRATILGPYGRSLMEPGPPAICVVACRPEMMRRENAEAIYRGVWPGLGRMYNVKVETGQTTIIVKPGEDLEQRVKQTQEKFARKDISIPASVGRV